MEGKLRRHQSRNGSNIISPVGLTLKRGNGFTLIEVIVDTLVITIVFSALVTAFIFLLNTVNAGKVRVSASSIANGQMESLRNLPYDSLATQNGTILPQGTIPDSQTVTGGGLNYLLTTAIVYIDDPFDGCAASIGGGLYRCTDGGTSTTQDTVPIDYKRITIKVAQANKPNLILASLTSDIAAKAAETPTDTGMLLIVVNDAQGQPIANATVVVTNESTGVSVTAYTNDQGYVFIAGLPPDTHNGYHIVVSLSGYSGDQTYVRTPQNPNQYQPDVSVSAQQITTQTLSIDQLSNMTVNVVSETGAPVSGVTVTATGNKITQNNPVTPKNIYNEVTDASGDATFSNIEWDGYTLTIPSGYYLVTTSPYQPVSLNPGSTLGVNMIITTNANFPRITDVAPNSSSSNQTVTIDINGYNFGADTSVLLRQSGQTDVTPTQTTVDSNQKSLSVTFNLAGVTSGNWDLILTTGGNTITQTKGFTVE